MVAVAGLAEDFVEQVGCTVDDEMLLVELKCRVHAAQHLDHAQAVERAMGIPDGAEDFLGAVLCGGIALLDRQVRAEFAFEIADMAGGEELVAGADAQVQVSGRGLLELDAEAFCFLLGRHEVVAVRL